MLALAAPCAALQASPPRSSGSARPADTLELSLAVGASTLGGVWKRYWSPSWAASGAVSAPLGPGRLRVGGDVDRARSDSVGIPGFWTLAPFMEWGPEGRWGPVVWSAAAGTGAAIQIIDRRENVLETELAATVTLAVAVPLSDRWLLGLRGRLRTVALAQPMTQPMVLLELRRRVRAPPGLGPALRDGEASGEPGADGGAGPRSARPDDPVPRPGYPLETEGWGSISELPARLPGWTNETVDLRRQRWSVGGLGVPGETSLVPEVTLDGLWLPLGTLGSVALERLGLAPGHLSAYTPLGVGLVDGRVGSGGALRLRTPVPPRGFRVGGEVWLAQPPGDAGPLIHTPAAPPNVDRVGQGFAALAAGGGRRWRADASVTSSRTFGGYGTRGARLAAVHEGPPLVDQVGGRVSVTRVGSRGLHRFQIGVSRRHDLVPFPEMAIDLPVSSELTWAGGTGGWETPGGRLEYAAAWSRDDHRPGPGPLAYGVGLSRRTEDVRASWSGPADAPGWRVGGGIRSVREAGVGADVSYTEVRAFGGLEGSVGPLGAVGEIEVGRVAGRMRWRGVARARIRILREGWAAMSVSHLEDRPEEWTGTWGLALRGWDVPEARGMGTRIPPGDPPALARTEVRVEAGWEWGGLRIGVEGGLRDVRGLLLARPRFSPGEPLPVPAAPTPVALDGGRVGGGGLTLDVETRGGWSGGLAWRASGLVGGGEAFREAWQTVPRRHGRVWGAWTGGPGLTLHTRVDHRSRTRWAAFPVDGQPTELPPVTEWSMGARKTLWDRRVELGLLVRDLLDQARGLHPLAGVPGRWVEVWFRLGGAGLGRGGGAE